MITKDKLLPYILDYLALKLEGFKYKNSAKRVFTCPLCKEISANIIPNADVIFCLACNRKMGNIFDLVKFIEADKKDYNEEQIINYLIALLKLKEESENNIDTILDLYVKNGFDLVPVAKNRKNPVEMDWTKKIHKDKIEWKNWLNTGLNIGCKTGQCSNVTVIDIDTQTVEKELQDILDKVKTLNQSTNKGRHYFFRYCEELPKTRLDDLKVDIENDGGQVVVYPSIVDNVKRALNIEDIIEIPEELKKYLLSKITIPNLKSFSDKLKEEIRTENFNLEIVAEGNRNNFLLRLGGILRKEMNISQVDYTLNIVNKHFCKPPLAQRELDAIVGSLNKYVSHDGIEFAQKVLQYMKIVEESNSRDIREALGENTAEGKQRIEKALKFLVTEGFLIKKRRAYHIIRKAEWKEEWFSDGKLIDFKIPYFDDIAIFRDGDMLIIGGKSGTGKTILAMNIVKQLVAQGKKPHYISLESGSRFLTHAAQLGLVEGDFKYCIHFKPENIELEKNAITIIDWLLPDDYATVDKLYKHFAEQLVKQGGILIVFTQLMQNNEFFAKNMVDLFAALACKFVYDDESGETSYLQTTKIREFRNRMRYCKIPCRYDFETKELKRIDDIENNKEEDEILKV